MAITTQNLRPYLQQCGYTADLIREDYSYADNSGQEYCAPIVGFAYPSYDCRNACITAIDAELLEAPAFESKAICCRDIGTPLLFICCRKELQWWSLTSKGVEFKERVPVNQIDHFFKHHHKEFSPESIYRAKNLSRVHSDYQLKFVDQGLMPVLEHEMGDRLADLIKNMLRVLDEKLGKPEKNIELQRWMFKCAFWLLGAKILQDKRVDRFINLNLEDISAVLQKVNQHYGAKEPLVFRTKRQMRALEETSKVVKRFSNLKNLTIESLAYVYENTLIDKKTRKAWGIHATPSYLVDYIVWQLFDWIRDIPQEKRVVLEPTCGHAPFLTSALRLLREIYQGDRADLHKYLKKHLHGIEQDSFAREIARLSLTLADVPNPNGWKLKDDDIYQGDVLSKLASKSSILICNPPFENFSKENKQEYKEIQTGNKAAEVLARTLPCMPGGSVFGIILPRGFLHKKNLADLRKYILDNFELRTICNLPDNVFAKAEHLSTVLLGRKINSRKKVSYVSVPKIGLKAFAENYQAKKMSISKEDLYKAEYYNFSQLEFKGIWEYCSSLLALGDIADIGRGIEHKSGLDIDSRRSFSKKQGFQKGFYNYNKNPNIDMLPDLVWLNTSQEYVQSYGSGMSDSPKILVNRIRGGRSSWRLRAWLDAKGYPFGKAFISVTPKADVSLFAIWALLNSPFVNTYLCDYCMERDNKEGVLKKVPVPEVTSLYKIEKIARNYFELSKQQSHFMSGDEHNLLIEKQKLLFAMDAEVMRLYDLPPRQEKQLLDFFYECPRKGVDFKFDRYFPEDFDSWIPLHEYLSEEYQRSTPSFVNDWVEKNRSPEIIKAFETAVEAFKED